MNPITNKNYFKFPLLLIILLTSLVVPNGTTANDDLERVLIMFQEQINEEFITSNNGTVLEELPSINTVVARVPEHSIETLKKHQAIQHVTIDQVVSITAPLTDWGTEKINAQQAWQSDLTGKGVKVAVMDTGVAPHPDLKISKGIAFTSYTDSYEDDNGHGTHVAGIIAAGQNPNGLKGIAPDVELYAIKVLDSEGDGFHSNVIKGIEWAIEHEVDIINLSVGGQESSPFLEAALKKAYEEHGILIVAAAGNNGEPDGEGTTVEFPASYRSVIAVAATDQFDERAPFSGHGSAVELSAPGMEIWSTYLNNGYETLYGTSMAAPHVTGMLALLKQAQPSRTNEELRTLIREYTDDLGVPGKDSLYGFGRIRFPEQIEIEAAKPLPPQNVTIEKINDANEIILYWQHPTATNFYIYRNGEKIQEVTNEFFYTEKIKEGTHIYEVTTVNEQGGESPRSTPITIKIEKNYQLTADKYLDVKVTDWFISPIHEFTNNKLIGGYPDGTLRPNQYVTRAELAAILGRTLQLNGAKQKAIFPDVRETLFASGYIHSATEQGLVSGYPDGTFRPNNVVTREEVAVFLTRAFPLFKRTDTIFPDVSKDHYTYYSIQLVVGEGIAAGYPGGTFKPKQGVTRAELVTFLFRALNK